MQHWITMVPLVSFLAALRILTEAQSCNNGIGRLVYEKISDYKLSGFGNKQEKEIITKTELPIKVLEECMRRCQEDRTTAIQQCLSFDFSPGKRQSSPFPNAHNALGPNGISAEYAESSCTLYFERGAPDGTDTLLRQQNAWHFNEVCLSSSKVSTECPNRLYVFERIPGYRFEGVNDKEIFTANRTECEDKCLNQSELPCRSATFDRLTKKCHLSRETRYMNSKGFKSDPNADYLENMCLKRTQMCTSTAFILETSKELDGAFERELITARDFQECSAFCLGSLEDRGFLCRSFVFDDAGHTCILYDEDPLFYGEISQDPRYVQQQTKRPLKPSAGNLYRVLCVNAERDESINNATVQCYRRKRLDGPRHEVEITTYSFQDCLEECTRRYGRNCKSVEYSSQQRSCRFSSQDGSDLGQFNLVDDANYDFYKFIWYRSANIPYPPLPHHQSPHHPPPPHVGGYGTGGYGGSGYDPGYNQPPPPNPTQSWNAWKDPHRNGFGYERHQGGYGSPGAPGLYSSSSNYGFGSRYPGYGHSGGHIPSPYSNGPLPPQPSGLPPLPPMPSNFPPPTNIPSPGYGIPYHGQGGHGYPPMGHPNSIQGGLAPFPPQFPIDKCRYPAGPPGAALGAPRFNRIGFGTRLRSNYIFKVIRSDRLEDCERACVESRDFMCRSFNFRGFFPAENCELSQYDSKQLKLDNPNHFEQHTQFDFYERDAYGSGPGSPADCLEVTQTCTPDGMEFTLKTPEGFYGRIYTYGFYDSCFYDGNGGSASVLRISRANGFPRCGTQQYGDAMTNIVVVQFNDYVQTSRDKKYNLTCYFSGPGEAVVTSNYLDTKVDGRYPTQIEHLPAQNILTSNVVLRVLYRGTPTNTIVVGDLLTFRLEARGQYRYDYYNSDIFATNVIAKDPYTGRQVHLIDSRGCPVDLYVFPELHKTPDGALEAEFYAFKIPDSNFLVFQATVRTCRGPCEPVICTDRGRGHGSFPSWGRKKRDISGGVMNNSEPVLDYLHEDDSYDISETSSKNSTDDDAEEEVHELLRVYLSRDDIPSAEAKEPIVMASVAPKVCVAQSGYYALVTAIVILVTLIMGMGAAGFFFFKKTNLGIKEVTVNRTNPNLYVSQTHNPTKFDDPSEPIYTDPSLFERSRSLRSLTLSTLGKPKDMGLVSE